MNETEAKAVAGAIGGEPWHTGGGVWCVRIGRADGSLVVLSADGCCQYDHAAEWPTAEHTTGIFWGGGC